MIATNALATEENLAQPHPAHLSGMIEASQLQLLLESLIHEGYEVIGPQVRDGAIVYDRLQSASQLPAGWRDEYGAGRYRLKPNQSAGYFECVLGAQSWKRYLHPAEVRLWSAQRENGSFRILNNETRPPHRYAFLGVRACELAAIALQDRVLLGDQYRDPIYEGRRAGLFVIAVECSRAAATCFCVSMQTGPRVSSGYDLCLTELVNPESHRFLVESGSDRGDAMLRVLDPKPVTEQDHRDAEATLAPAREQARTLDVQGIEDLFDRCFEAQRWEQVGGRCLACANCTLVCPTCFCTTVEDTSDVTGRQAERWRRWDSCFTLSFSYIHGGSVRTSTKARYRQWLTHKFAAWQDQFGSSGCVGCGRCITWCPAGIDVTEEIRVLREGAPHGDA